MQDLDVDIDPNVAWRWNLAHKFILCLGLMAFTALVWNILTRLHPALVLILSFGLYHVDRALVPHLVQASQQYINALPRTYRLRIPEWDWDLDVWCGVEPGTLCTLLILLVLAALLHSRGWIW